MLNMSRHAWARARTADASAPQPPLRLLPGSHKPCSHTCCLAAVSSACSRCCTRRAEALLVSLRRRTRRSCWDSCSPLAPTKSCAPRPGCQYAGAGVLRLGTLQVPGGAVLASWKLACSCWEVLGCKI